MVAVFAPIGFMGSLKGERALSLRGWWHGYR